MSHGEQAAFLYWRIKRDPEEGTASAAIKAHTQACGFVAHILNVHPDQVAESVSELQGTTQGEGDTGS